MKAVIIGSSGHWAYALQELKKFEAVWIVPGFAGEDMSGVINTLTENTIPFRAFEDPAGVPEADIAIINTRFDLNALYTIAYLEKHIPVFSEKPLALTEKELDRIEALAQKTPVCAMFGITYEPWCLCMKQNIGRIGEIRLANGQKSYKLGTRPGFYFNKKTFGGLMPWVGIHAIHWIYALTKQAMAVKSAQSFSEGFAQGTLETAATAQFRLAGGGLATVSADYFRPSAAVTHDDDRLRLVGTKGILEYRGGKVTLLDQNGEQELPLPQAEDIFALFLARLQDGTSGISPEESCEVTRIALQAQREAEKNCI